jgi:hypothetical protein
VLEEFPMVAGTVTKIVCEVHGSSTPPIFEWRFGNKSVTGHYDVVVCNACERYTSFIVHMSYFDVIFL